MAEKLPDPKKIDCPKCEVPTETPHCIRSGCPWVVCPTCHLVIRPRPIMHVDAPDVKTIPHMPVEKP